MIQRMQQRRGLESQWTSVNPILAAAEIGYELDNNKFKIGDGITPWNDLGYFEDASSVQQLIQDLIGAAPEVLDTLEELAAAIENNPNFFTDIADDIASAQSAANNYTDMSIGNLNLSGGTTGQVPQKNSSDEYDISWADPVRSLNDIDDVSAETPSNSDTILYNSSTGNWEAGQINLSDLPGVPSVIGDLSDVSITDPQRDDILVYDGTEWKNGTSDLEVLFWTYA